MGVKYSSVSVKGHKPMKRNSCRLINTPLTFKVETFGAETR